MSDKLRAMTLDYRDVMRALMVRLIQTPISTAFTVKLGEDPATAAEALRIRNFDQAPVLDGSRVIGIARRDLLGAALSVAQVVRPLSDGLLISADTPLADLPSLLVQEPFRFVVDGADVSGFVTRWDLNKQPARTQLYLFLADLEIALASLMRRRYRGGQMAAIENLGSDRAKRIRGRYRAAQRQNREADVVAMLDFEDLLEISGTDEYLRRRLGFETSEQWEEAINGLGNLRKGVMHLTGELVGKQLTLDELIAVEHRARLLAGSASGVGRMAAFKSGSRGAAISQRVTRIDITAGRVRLPKSAKGLFPSQRGRVPISIRGRAFTVQYDPRLGPDRERSAVLLVGRSVLEGAIAPGERLYVSLKQGVVYLD